jgi:hypothetical protein
MPDIIQSLWVGSELAIMEQMSANSFVKNGHEFHLYLYDDIAVPDGVVVKDANEILPSSEIFCYGEHTGMFKGSLAAFSNLFRYELLLKRGGYWVDLDIICLKFFDFSEPYVFGKVDECEVGSAVIKTPKNCDLSRFFMDECRRKDLNKINHGEIGPDLVTRGIFNFTLQRYIKDANIFYPIHWSRHVDLFNPHKCTVCESSYAVHLWNEMWRHTKTDKNAEYHKDCLYEQFKRKFL